MRGRVAAAVTAAIACAVALAACGGGERQDADEPEGEFALEVVDASFPRAQAIAQRSTLELVVRNTDTERAPNVAVTIETEPKQRGQSPGAFAQSRDDASLADPSRPVWVLDRGPAGGETAYTNTWALGPLEPGETRTFEWRVTAVQPGRYTVGYQVSPGLDGKAKLEGDGGTGEFKVTIDDDPVDARIGKDGETVVREQPGE